MLGSQPQWALLGQLVAPLVAGQSSWAPSASCSCLLQEPHCLQLPGCFPHRRLERPRQPHHWHPLPSGIENPQTWCEPGSLPHGRLLGSSGKSASVCLATYLVLVPGCRGQHWALIPLKVPLHTTAPLSGSNGSPFSRTMQGWAWSMV